MNTGKLKLWWVPCASTVNVTKWRRQMLAVDGLCCGLAVLFNWPYNTEILRKAGLI